LWHNSFLPAAREKRVYERLVDAVTAPLAASAPGTDGSPRSS